jgi:excisionase family DNA binding protein
VTRALTPADVAERFGATEWYIRQLARDKKIPHLRVGRGAIAFTEAQAAAVEAHLTQNPESEVAPRSLTSRRSRARRAS